MTFLRRLIAWRPLSSESLSLDDVQKISGNYLGHTFACQPNSDELHRAVTLLTARHKRDTEENALRTFSAYFERSSIVLRDEEHRKRFEFEIRKVVVCCVDPKNRKVFAIFYHDGSPFVGCATSSRGLECHLFMAKRKEVARLAAMKVAQLLDAIYMGRARGTSADIEEGNLRISTRGGPTDDDIDYEEISYFFKTKVFKGCSRSKSDTPDSVATRDSENASAVANRTINFDNVSARYASRRFERQPPNMRKSRNVSTECVHNGLFSDVSDCLSNASVGSSGEAFTSSARSSSSELLLTFEFPLRAKSSSATTYGTLRKASSDCVCLGQDGVVVDEAKTILSKHQEDLLNNDSSTSDELQRLLELCEIDA